MDENDNTEPGLEIEGPISLLPDLANWGIDPADIGTCEDTFDNRRLLRENAARWIPVFTTEGKPTNLIQVVSKEMRQASLLSSKKTILTDSRDSDSEYVTGLRLVAIPQTDTLVPAWVVAATREWIRIDEERKSRGPDEKTYRPAIFGPPTRCRATTISGGRCANWSGGRLDQNGLCRTHIAAHQYDKTDPGIHTLAKARARLISATLNAVDGLEHLANSATSEPVRLGAMKEILDRGGLRGGFEIDQKVEVTGDSSAQIVAERLNKLRENNQKRVRELEEAAKREAEAIPVEIVIEVADE